MDNETTLQARGAATAMDEAFAGLWTLSPSARIARLHGMAEGAARLAVAAACAAGCELRRVKASLPPGAWSGWLAQNVNFSRMTAFRYMALSAQLLPELPAEGEAEVPPEGSAADGRSLSELYQELGIARKSRNCGGARPGAGRPPANPDPSDDAVRAITVALDQWSRRVPDAVYRFLPLREAEGALASLDAARDKIRARIEELRAAAPAT